MDNNSILDQSNISNKMTQKTNLEISSNNQQTELNIQTINPTTQTKIKENETNNN